MRCIPAPGGFSIHIKPPTCAGAASAVMYSRPPPHHFHLVSCLLGMELWAVFEGGWFAFGLRLKRNMMRLLSFSHSLQPFHLQ